MADVTLTDPRYRRQIEGTLLDAPPVQRKYGSIMFRPGTITIEYSFNSDACTWSAKNVEISGPRLRKDGTDAQGLTGNTYYLRGLMGDLLPKWLETLVDQHTPEGSP